MVEKYLHNFFNLLPVMLYRFYFGANQNKCRKFCWFEMKGSELYWGASSPIKQAVSTIEGSSENTISIKTPEDFKKLNFSNGKFSYHESGQFHYKSYQDPNTVPQIKRQWDLKQNLVKPTRIFSLITMTIENYSLSLKDVWNLDHTRQIINFKEPYLQKRLYIEFYLSPEGKHNLPPALIKMDNLMKDFFYVELETKIFLGIRFAKLVNLESWFPDTEVQFIPKGLKNDT